MLASAARSERYEPSRRQVVRQKSGPVWSAVRLATVVGTSPWGRYLLTNRSATASRGDSTLSPGGDAPARTPPPRSGCVMVCEVLLKVWRGDAFWFAASAPTLFDCPAFGNVLVSIQRCGLHG